MFLLIKNDGADFGVHFYTKDRTLTFSGQVHPIGIQGFAKISNASCFTDKVNVEEFYSVSTVYDEETDTTTITLTAKEDNRCVGCGFFSTHPLVETVTSGNSRTYALDYPVSYAKSRLLNPNYAYKISFSISYWYGIGLYLVTDDGSREQIGYKRINDGDCELYLCLNPFTADLRQLIQ